MRHAAMAKRDEITFEAHRACSGSVS